MAPVPDPEQSDLIEQLERAGRNLIEWDAGAVNDAIDLIKRQAEALQALEQQLNEARGERDEARSRREWTEQWYAERFERLRDLAKEKGIWSEAAAILANGTVSPMEPPHYGQQLNTTRHRAEAAERREEGLRKALARLVTDAINAHPHTATSHQPGLAKGIQEARVALFDFQEGGEPRARGIEASEGGSATPEQEVRGERARAQLLEDVHRAADDVRGHWGIENTEGYDEAMSDLALALDVLTAAERDGSVPATPTPPEQSHPRGRSAELLPDPQHPNREDPNA